jgi:hypothetical protein
MKGGSSNLDVAIPNILSAAIPVNPPTYDWNIPATVETNPSCKFIKSSKEVIFFYLLMYL